MSVYKWLDFRKNDKQSIQVNERPDLGNSFYLKVPTLCYEISGINHVTPNLIHRENRVNLRNHVPFGPSFLWSEVTACAACAYPAPPCHPYSPTPSPPTPHSHTPFPRQHYWNNVRIYLHQGLCTHLLQAVFTVKHSPCLIPTLQTFRLGKSKNTCQYSLH